MRKLLVLTLLAAAAGLSGCGDFKMPGVYRLNVQQGNVITAQELAQLRPGMSKRKVEFLLGTPLLVDTFNPDRWYYVYTYQKGGGTRHERKVAVVFEHGGLARVEGDVKSSAKLASAGSSKDVVVEVPGQPQDTSFWDKLIHPFGWGEKEQESAGHAQPPPKQPQPASASAQSASQAQASTTKAEIDPALETAPGQIPPGE